MGHSEHSHLGYQWQCSCVLAFDNGHLERDRLDVSSEKGPDEWGEDML